MMKYNVHEKIGLVILMIYNVSVHEYIGVVVLIMKKNHVCISLHGCHMQV